MSLTTRPLHESRTQPAGISAAGSRRSTRSQNKLLERVKFLSIVCSNLDEFFMVRVAAMKQKLATGRQALSIDGKTVDRATRRRARVCRGN